MTVDIEHVPPPVPDSPRQRSTPGRGIAWLIIVGWLALVVGGTAVTGSLSEVENNEASAWLPARAESTRVLEIVEGFRDSGAETALVVYEREGGLTDGDRAAIAAHVSAAGSLAVATIPPPTAAPDGEALLLVVPLPDDDETLTANVEALRDVVQPGAPPGLDVFVTGPAGASADLESAFDGVESTLLIATVVVVTVVLLLTYRSPVLWLLPLLVVGLANVLTNAIVWLLADRVGLVVNAQSIGILTVLVFGVGTDYALLLIARYREELHRHEDRYVAMWRALRSAFPALLASATTVAIGMLCLLAADLNSTRSLGPVAAIGIATAFVAMTTLLPALLVVLGRWVFWPFTPRFDPAEQATQHRTWERVGRLVGRRPRALWIGTTLGLAALALGITTLSSGLPMSGMFTSTPESVTGQQTLEAHFPGGSGDPADILVRQGFENEAASEAAVVSGVVSVEEQGGTDGWIQLSAVLTDATDSDAAKATVTRLRAAVHDIDGADALVGGSTAIELDTEAAVERDERVVMPLILGVVLLVLLVLLRAIVLPIVLLLSVVLSYAAALGASALLLNVLGYDAYSQAFLPLPLFAFLFLVALGVDYTIFLMTRAREEVSRTGDARNGVLRALAVTGGVITSAGLVLAATFAVLAVLPVVPMLQLGVVVAVGVLLDTLVVRSLLVPAATLDLGIRAWWPSRLGVRSGP
jgi:putative drug exporter of the RND superfamily